MKESQLGNKTSIATNDYVRMVDENGNSVKIKKDSFMAAIRDALPSIISDGETGGGSVLSIINGALKTRTDANLASVLGAVVNQGDATKNTSANTYTTPGIWSFNADSNPLTDIPGDAGYGNLIVFYSGNAGGGAPVTQIIQSYNAAIYARIRWATVWTSWKRLDNFG